MGKTFYGAVGRSCMGESRSEGGVFCVWDRGFLQKCKRRQTCFSAEEDAFFIQECRGRQIRFSAQEEAVPEGGGGQGEINAAAGML